MKNLIYQCYDGELLPGNIAGIDAMKKYASHIGAKYLFEYNTNFGAKNISNIIGKNAYFYNCLKPIYDTKFHEYDNVLYADIDIFPVEGLEQNIFDEFTAEIGICTEPLRPVLRRKSKTHICRANDEKFASVVEKNWNIKVQRTPEGFVKVYNAGLELWSKHGLIKAQERFVIFEEYINLIMAAALPVFYAHDQNYFQTMLKVANMDYVELDNDWNCLVHHYMDENGKHQLNDPRTKNTKFVHIQLVSAEHWNANTLWKITNLPVSEWKLK